MDRFAKRISNYSVVGLDTSIFIYHFEKNLTYTRLTRELFTLIEAGTLHGLTSTITLLEISVRPLSLNREDIARKYEALLVNFPNLDVVDIDRDTIRQAARLRARYHLRPPDALQISACILHGAQTFVTNDRRLDRLVEKLDVIILDDSV